jgi:hypothetical protein
VTKLLEGQTSKSPRMTRRLTVKITRVHQALKCHWNGQDDLEVSRWEEEH